MSGRPLAVLVGINHQPHADTPTLALWVAARGPRSVGAASPLQGAERCQLRTSYRYRPSPATPARAPSARRTRSPSARGAGAKSTGPTPSRRGRRRASGTRRGRGPRCVLRPEPEEHLELELVARDAPLLGELADRRDEAPRRAWRCRGSGRAREEPVGVAAVVPPDRRHVRVGHRRRLGVGPLAQADPGVERARPARRRRPSGGGTPGGPGRRGPGSPGRRPRTGRAWTG